MVSNSQWHRPQMQFLLRLLFLSMVVPGMALADTPPSRETRIKALLDAYPDALARVENNIVYFRDGRELPFDDGIAQKTFEAVLETPDIEDMFSMPYPLAFGVAPALQSDPGRVRNARFFNYLYGDCRSPTFARTLVDVIWLPKKSGARLKVTRLNGVAAKLEAISRELDALPDRFTPYLVPPAGGYHCRPIAGTSRMSGHGYGIALDIATRHAHYWRWSQPQTGATVKYQNAIPAEIVAIFEKHGFIWGGKWYHHDTMHFEYRPEILTASRLQSP